MTTNMKWNNIELDHVHPLSSFSLTNPNQLKEASHYSNIQPLLKPDIAPKAQNFMSMI